MAMPTRVSSVVYCVYSQYLPVAGLYETNSLVAPSVWIKVMGPWVSSKVWGLNILKVMGPWASSKVWGLNILKVMGPWVSSKVMGTQYPQGYGSMGQ